MKNVKTVLEQVLTKPYNVLLIIVCIVVIIYGLWLSSATKNINKPFKYDQKVLMNKNNVILNNHNNNSNGKIFNRDIVNSVNGTNSISKSSSGVVIAQGSFIPSYYSTPITSKISTNNNKRNTKTFWVLNQVYLYKQQLYIPGTSQQIHIGNLTLLPITKKHQWMTKDASKRVINKPLIVFDYSELARTNYFHFYESVYENLFNIIDLYNLTSADPILISSSPADTKSKYDVELLRAMSSQVFFTPPDSTQLNEVDPKAVTTDTTSGEQVIVFKSKTYAGFLSLPARRNRGNQLHRFRKFMLSKFNFRQGPNRLSRFQSNKEKGIKLGIVQRRGDRSITNLESITKSIKSLSTSPPTGTSFDIIDVKIISFENMTFKQQVKAVSQLDILIAPHGSSTTNTIWMPPHAVLIEVFPMHYTEPHYRDLCQDMKRRYFNFESNQALYWHKSKNYDKCARREGTPDRSSCIQNYNLNDSCCRWYLRSQFIQIDWDHDLKPTLQHAINTTYTPHCLYYKARSNYQFFTCS